MLLNQNDPLEDVARSLALSLYRDILQLFNKLSTVITTDIKCTYDMRRKLGSFSLLL